MFWLRVGDFVSDAFVGLGVWFELILSNAGSTFQGEQLRRSNERLTTADEALLEAVSPRLVEQDLSAKRLKPFAEMSVVVTSPMDTEPRRTAGMIRFLLSQAGWSRANIPATPALPFFDGVVIHAGMPSIADPDPAVVKERREKMKRTVEAVELLISVLGDNGVEARRGHPFWGLDFLEIMVVVGPKPLPKLLRGLALSPGVKGGTSFGNILEYE